MSFRSVPSSRRMLTVAAMLGSSLVAAEAMAAIVSIDLTNAGSPGQNILGINSGLASGTKALLIDFVPGGEFEIFNNYPSSTLTLMGFDVDGFAVGVSFQMAAGFTTASPQNFAANTAIGLASATSWTGSGSRLYFSNGTSISPDFGANSFMGFRFGSSTAGWNYGYLEVLWDSTGTADWNTTGAAAFKLVSAAYESDLNTAITTPEAVPVPGMAGVLACGALGLGRRRQR